MISATHGSQVMLNLMHQYASISGVRKMKIDRPDTSTSVSGWLHDELYSDDSGPMKVDLAWEDAAELAEMIYPAIANYALLRLMTHTKRRRLTGREVARYLLTFEVNYRPQTDW
jgi:hypothetical protein